MVYRWSTNEYATETGTFSASFKPEIDPRKGHLLFHAVVDKMDKYKFVNITFINKYPTLLLSY